MDRLTLGAILFFVMLLLILIGMPTFVAMFVVGVGGMIVMVGWSATMGLLSIIPRTQLTSFDWVVIPLFVFMGVVLMETGIASELFTALRNWIGNVPGGVGAATEFAGALIGTMTGSGFAATALLSRMAYPEMVRFGYRKDLALAICATAGPLAMIIPPSITIVIAAILAEASIAGSLLGGLGPGFLVMLFYSIMLIVRCRANPSLGPAVPLPPWRTKLFSLLYIIPVLIIMGTIVGGLLLGIFTATEAAGCGAAVSVCVALGMERVNYVMLKRSILEALRLSLMIMLLIMCALGFYVKFLSISGISLSLARACLAFPSPWITIALMYAFQFIAGMFIGNPMNYVVIPLFAPIIIELGFPVVWFVICCIMMTITGTVSPPVCICLFIAQSIIKEVPMMDAYKAVIPFLGCNLVVIAIMVAWPELVIWIPRAAGYTVG